MRNTADFRRTIRRGVRVGRPTVVVHAQPSGQPTVRVGLVVAKTVGNAVTRNRVKRQLRHLAASCLPETPGGLDLVLRALPSAAHHPDELRTDLPEAWQAATAKLARREDPL